MLAPRMAHRFVCRPSVPVIFAAFVTFVGLSCTPYSPSSPPPPLPAPPTTDAEIIGWAIGPEQRSAPPPSSGYSILPLSPGQAPAESVLPSALPCYPITSFVPAPAPELGFFVVVGGKINRLTTTNEAPVPLEGGDQVPPVTRLLAFAKHPVDTRELLVAVQRAGVSKDELWLVRLEEGKIKAARQASDRRAFASKDAFFKHYNAPHCRDRDEHCLVLNPVRGPNGKIESLVIDEERKRDKPPVEYQKVGIPMADATWSADGKRIWVLVPCE